MNCMCVYVCVYLYIYMYVCHANPHCISVVDLHRCGFPRSPEGLTIGSNSYDMYSWDWPTSGAPRVPYRYTIKENSL